MNPEVERFLKEQEIDFLKKQQIAVRCMEKNHAPFLFMTIGLLAKPAIYCMADTVL
ncbi:MAG: hypothetical protein LUI12_10055 [Clostridiales bacterium]|nr:hypothetical protein [Clostridiales bacterium]